MCTGVREWFPSFYIYIFVLTPPSCPLLLLCVVELERGLSFVGILALENRLKAETVPHLRLYQVKEQ
jgi:hypothetical protein